MTLGTAYILVCHWKYFWDLDRANFAAAELWFVSKWRDKSFTVWSYVSPFHGFRTQNNPELLLAWVRHGMSVTLFGASGCIIEFIDMGTQIQGFLSYQIDVLYAHTFGRAVIMEIIPIPQSSFLSCDYFGSTAQVLSLTEMQRRKGQNISSFCSYLTQISPNHWK